MTDPYDTDFETRARRNSWERRFAKFSRYLATRPIESWGFFIAGLFIGGLFL